jgi:hypothetical protein
MYVFNFFRDAILISYTLVFMRGVYLAIYKYIKMKYIYKYIKMKKKLINPQTQKEYYPEQNVLLQME